MYVKVYFWRSNSRIYQVSTISVKPAVKPWWPRRCSRWWWVYYNFLKDLPESCWINCARRKRFGCVYGVFVPTCNVSKNYFFRNS